jgi:diaminopimelate decarboxylase
MFEPLSPVILKSIGEEFGTPVYVYHAEKILEQFQKLTRAFNGSRSRFFYACKALTNINVLRYIREIGCNIDCSSINEAKLALRAGFDPSSILYTSNNISFEELIEAAELKIHINIDSLSNLRKFGKKFGAGYPVGIRLRPNIMAGGNLKISTGHDSSKFGIPLEQIDQVFKVVEETGVVINGLHIHTGSDIADVEVFVRGVEILYDLAVKFPSLKYLDLGGGFKVRYKSDDHESDITELGRRLSEIVKEYDERTGLSPEIWFEPGKYLVSEAGYLVTTVTVMKETPSINFVGLNTGLNHLIRPMFYDAYHTIINLSNPDAEKKRYTVVGNICETDTFATDRELPIVHEGDYLGFLNAGAYCFEMSSNYNSRFRPAEVLVRDGMPKLIRKAEVLEDLLRNQVGV